MRHHFRPVEGSPSGGNGAWSQWLNAQYVGFARTAKRASSKAQAQAAARPGYRIACFPAIIRQPCEHGLARLPAPVEAACMPFAPRSCHWTDSSCALFELFAPLTLAGLRRIPTPHAVHLSSPHYRSMCMLCPRFAVRGSRHAYRFRIWTFAPLPLT